MPKHVLILLVAVMSSGCAAWLQREAKGLDVRPRTGVWEFKAVKQNDRWSAFAGGAALRLRLTFDGDHALVAQALEPPKEDRTVGGLEGGFQLIVSRPAWEVPKRVLTAPNFPGHWEDGRCGFVLKSEPASLGVGESYQGEFKLTVRSESSLDGAINILPMTLPVATPTPVATVDPMQSIKYESGRAPRFTPVSGGVIWTSDIEVVGRWLPTE